MPGCRGLRNETPNQILRDFKRTCLWKRSTFRLLRSRHPSTIPLENMLLSIKSNILECSDVNPEKLQNHPRSIW